MIASAIWQHTALLPITPSTYKTKEQPESNGYVLSLCLPPDNAQQELQRLTTHKHSPWKHSIIWKPTNVITTQDYKPTHENSEVETKNRLEARTVFSRFKLFFLRLVWPWVVKFGGLVQHLFVFPTQQNLPDRRTPYQMVVFGRSIRDIPLFIRSSFHFKL